MSSAYDRAAAALFRAPFDAFVPERKRLAAELSAQGDAAGAARLGKLPRPSIAAWAMNQLYWHERDAFAELFETAQRLRELELDDEATAAHREAIAKLRTRAAELLAGAGKPASETTLRRVTATLSALAASGGFAPDPPGMLLRERDAPGFEVVGLAGFVPSKKKSSTASARGDAAAKEHRTREDAAAERRHVERERAELRAERERLERKLRIARSTLEGRADEVARMERGLAEAMDAVEEARGVVRELEARVAELERKGQ